MSANLSLGSDLTDLTLAAIATSLPGATAVFRRNKLDFCCGGGILLADATRAKGLSLPEIEADLAANAALALPAERPNGTEELIDFIETRYHAVHRRGLPELVGWPAGLKPSTRLIPGCPAVLPTISRPWPPNLRNT